MRSSVSLGVVCVICGGTVWLFSALYQKLQSAYEESGTLNAKEYSWFFRLLLNLVGYSTVLLPMFILYKYLDRINYFDKITNSGVMSRALFSCFGEPGERLPDTNKNWTEESPRKEAAELAFCFLGLMTTYLVWGLLQEKIMTQNYTLPDGSTVKFNDSQFLVFVNRLLALGIAATRLLLWAQPLVVAPLYRFSYCALTNVVSAWCQYEALKYVSFPTQVLSKSCKVIPVMVMGTLVSRNKYEAYEYTTAALISGGMLLFMLGAQGDVASGSSSSLVSGWSGAALLALYMSCDSFTSSWQSALFAKYRCEPLHMLAGVNLFSCLLTGAALVFRATPASPLGPLLQHPVFVADVAMLSASSALGQLLIYRTIAKFGAVAFTIIMTLRQALSILLSCLVYGHAVSWGGAVGVALVFGAVLLRLYCRQRIRRRRPPPAAAPL